MCSGLSITLHFIRMFGATAKGFASLSVVNIAGEDEAPSVKLGGDHALALSLINYFIRKFVSGRENCSRLRILDCSFPFRI